MNLRSFVLSGRRRLRQVTVVAATASVLLTGILAFPVGATAAEAASVPVPLSCTQLHFPFCMWHDSDYRGTQWVFPEFGSGHQDGFWWSVGSAANDKVSSLHNGTLSWGFIAKNCPADGEWTWVGAGSSNTNLAGSEWPDLSNMNDSISAFGIGTQGEPHPNFPDHGSRINGGC